MCFRRKASFDPAAAGPLPNFAESIALCRRALPVDRFTEMRSSNSAPKE